MRVMHVALTLSLMIGAGCGKGAKDEPEAGGHQGMAMDSGMEAMPGMGKSSMMPMMQAHMDSMMRMSPAEMSRSMARHERMMSEMMDRMGGEMRQMNMSATGEWTALTDSIRQDLAELPSLRGQQLQARMRGHGERVRRLISAHEDMMKAMH